VGSSAFCISRSCRRKAGLREGGVSVDGGLATETRTGKFALVFVVLETREVKRSLGVSTMSSSALSSAL
jgi:hypothetical protein